MIIDSHAHLDYPQLAGDLPAVLARARDAGVDRVITIGVKLSTVERPRAIAEANDNIWFSVACIRTGRQRGGRLQCRGVSRAATIRGVVIGERGSTIITTMRRVTGRPRFSCPDHGGARTRPADHRPCREADDDIADIIEDDKGMFRGVLHCFSSGPELARRAIEAGFYVSFSGILTFKSATAIQQVAADSPEDRILVETDAPYLAPVPMRGKPNEPAYTSHTRARLAEIRQTDVDRMAAVTRANTLRLFSRMGEG